MLAPLPGHSALVSRLVEGLWRGLCGGEGERPGACAPRRPGAQGWVDGWGGC
jgi:hypothetical protein